MRKTIITAVAGSALLLAGCGAGGSSGASGNGSDDTKFTDIAKLASVVGEKQSDKKTAHITMKGDLGGQTLDGKGQIDLSNPKSVAESVDMTAQGKPISVIVKDGVFYIKSPEMAQAGGSTGKPWVKIDSNGSNPIAKSFGAMMNSMTQNSDPTKLVDQVKETGRITKSETENDLTHYWISIDTKKSLHRGLEQAKAAAGAAGGTKVLEETEKKLDQQIDSGKVPKETPAELWLNSENLPTKFETSTAVPDPKSQEVKTVKFSGEYTDWGKPVTIAAPPANQVTDLDAMLSKSGR